MRPKLNLPTVLDDWTWAEPLEGFVWEVLWDPQSINIFDREIVTTKEINMTWPVWASLKGVLRGSKFEQWAIRVNVPVYDSIEDVE